jgi:hypothetical protein
MHTTTHYWYTKAPPTEDLRGCTEQLGVLVGWRLVAVTHTNGKRGPAEEQSEKYLQYPTVDASDAKARAALGLPDPMALIASGKRPLVTDATTLAQLQALEQQIMQLTWTGGRYEASVRGENKRIGAGSGETMAEALTKALEDLGEQ